MDYNRHVQVNNESAIDFYKKFGFEIVETKEHYYKRIEPADAHVLQKDLKRSQVSGGTAAVAVTNNCHQPQSNGLDTQHNHHTHQQQLHGGKSKA